MELEKIYTLAEIDVSTIKPMGGDTESEAPAMLAVDSRCVISSPSQAQVPSSQPAMEFDFGLEGQETIDSFLLAEPIEVLCLSQAGIKTLRGNGYTTLGDLYKSYAVSADFPSGVGQGHVDEARHKLKQYINGRPLLAVNTIDWKSFVAALTGDINQTYVWCALEQYCPASLCSLTPYETTQVKKIKDEEKEAAINDVLRIITLPERKAFVHDMLGKVLRVWIKPWARKRFGLITEYEVCERLRSLSIGPEMFTTVIAFLQRVYYPDKSIFHHFLMEADISVFAVDEESLAQYRTIMNKAKSYFYRPWVWYSLNDLLSFLTREYTQQWEHFPLEHLQRALRISPQFRLWKDSHHTVCIRR